VPVRRLVLVVPLALAIALAGCGSGDDEPTSTKAADRRPPVTLGTKNFTEQFVLGQLYKQALEAKGFRVVLKNNIGASEIVDRALTNGRIDLYPEYTGVIVSEIARAKRRPHSAAETYRRAKAFEARRGFAVLARSPGQDVDVNAVRPAYARRYRLKTNADLARVGGFRYGGPAENRSRFQGAVGLRKVYGLHNLRYVPTPIENRYSSLISGKVDVIAVFSTEWQLTERHKYALLADPDGVFGFQNIVPVVKRSVAERQGPAFTRTLDAVTTRLTTRALREMNAAVDRDGAKPADVAAKFLEAHGLK
jgi:osmoprotectant transport system substrate-binding protein